MSRSVNRQRRPVTRRQLTVLRAMGWRYSTTREAWVHRSRGGRRGPVFRLRETEVPGTFAVIDDQLLAHLDELAAPGVAAAEAPTHEVAEPDDDEVEAYEAVAVGHPAARAHLPARPRPQLPPTLVVTQPPATTKVVASLTGDEPARLITVDGRPPAVISPEDFRAPNVVLIKPPRASA